MKVKKTSVTPCHNLNVFLSPLDHFSTGDQWPHFFPVLRGNNLFTLLQLPPCVFSLNCSVSKMTLVFRRGLSGCSFHCCVPSTLFNPCGINVACATDRAKLLAPVVQKGDNTIHLINLWPVDSAMVSLVLKRYIMIYPVDSTIQHLNNQTMVKSVHETALIT